MENSDNEGGKRRSKIGKVKAFEEMLLKDVPGMTNNQLNVVLTFRHFNLQVTYM